MVRFGVIVAILEFVFTVYAVADCATIDRWRIQGLQRGWWIVVILLVPIFGAVLWLWLGRGRPLPARPVAPDDDVEFLRGLAIHDVSPPDAGFPDNPRVTGPDGPPRPPAPSGDDPAHPKHPGHDDEAEGTSRG